MRLLNRARSRLLPKAAEGLLHEREIDRLCKGIDIIGDIGIVKLSQELESRKHEIARRLLVAAPYLRVVLRQTGPVRSRLRTRELEWLAGEKRTETTHREYGCTYKIDLQAVYFSPRLSSERKRIADQVRPGECVLNFFAGAGPFSIMIAKHARPSRVYSLDLNPAAVHYHALNNRLNRVGETIDIICGEANSVVQSSLQGQANRVLLPLPELAMNSLETAKSALQAEHGCIHCYLFASSGRRKGAGPIAMKELDQDLDRLGLVQRDAQVHVVRSVSPCRYQVCIDIVL